MVNQYYLFGKDVIIAYYYSTLDETKELLELKRGVVYKHQIGTSADNLLRKFRGWDDFTQITEREYQHLK